MNSNAFTRSGTEYQLSDESLSSQPKASRWIFERQGGKAKEVFCQMQNFLGLSGRQSCNIRLTIVTPNVLFIWQYWPKKNTLFNWSLPFFLLWNKLFGAVDVLETWILTHLWDLLVDKVCLENGFTPPVLREAMYLRPFGSVHCSPLEISFLRRRPLELPVKDITLRNIFVAVFNLFWHHRSRKMSR